MDRIHRRPRGAWLLLCAGLLLFALPRPASAQGFGGGANGQLLGMMRGMMDMLGTAVEEGAPLGELNAIDPALRELVRAMRRGRHHRRHQHHRGAFGAGFQQLADAANGNDPNQNNAAADAGGNGGQGAQAVPPSTPPADGHPRHHHHHGKGAFGAGLVQVGVQVHERVGGRSNGGEAKAGSRGRGAFRTGVAQALDDPGQGGKRRVPAATANPTTGSGDKGGTKSAGGRGAFNVGVNVAVRLSGAGAGVKVSENVRVSVRGGGSSTVNVNTQVNISNRTTSRKTGAVGTLVGAKGGTGTKSNSGVTATTRTDGTTKTGNRTGLTGALVGHKSARTTHAGQKQGGKSGIGTLVASGPGGAKTGSATTTTGGVKTAPGKGPAANGNSVNKGTRAPIVATAKGKGNTANAMPAGKGRQQQKAAGTTQVAVKGGAKAGTGTVVGKSPRTGNNAQVKVRVKVGGGTAGARMGTHHPGGQHHVAANRGGVPHTFHAGHRGAGMHAGALVGNRQHTAPRHPGSFGGGRRR